ncbi:hypothetical protein GCM10022197_42830 [Microlunatus spumicola]|uniref:Uncharacterized protein n=1 Tax=Microlunatus spumicola TaxID=81499 RepID=A0ABP6YCN3_9ACTN
MCSGCCAYDATILGAAPLLPLDNSAEPGALGSGELDDGAAVRHQRDVLTRPPLSCDTLHPLISEVKRTTAARPARRSSLSRPDPPPVRLRTVGRRPPALSAAGAIVET